MFKRLSFFVVFALVLTLNLSILSVFAEPDASINIKTIEDEGNGLQGIVYSCEVQDRDNGDEVVESKGPISDADGNVKWEVEALENHTYYCEATAGYPDCYEPAADKQKSIEVTSLSAGDDKQFELSWKFTPDKEVGGKTCEEIKNPPEEPEEPEEEEEEEEELSIVNAKIPSDYSVTPDVTQLTMETAKSVDNLKIAYTGSNDSTDCENDEANNYVQWTDSVDLTGEGLDDKFSNLDRYIKVDEKGKIELDLSSLEELDEKREIYMTGLSYSLEDDNEPILLVDGEEASLKDLKFEKTTLSYESKEGENFALKPMLEVEECSRDDIDGDGCEIKGKVDNLCTKVTIDITGDKKIKETVEVDESGEFTHEFEDLDKEGDFKFKVIAKLSNGEEEKHEWEVMEPWSITNYLWAMLIIILLVIGGGGYYLFYRSKKKREEKETLEQKTRKIIKEIERIYRTVRTKYGEIDLSNDSISHIYEKLLFLKKDSDKLGAIIKPVDPKEKVDHEALKVLYDQTAQKLEDFRRVIMEDVALNDLARDTKPEDDDDDDDVTPTTPNTDDQNNNQSNNSGGFNVRKI